MPLRLILTALLTGIAGTATGQPGTGAQRLMGNKRGDLVIGCHRVYVCTGTGINSPTGIAGVQLDVAVTGRVSANIGAGIGTWGFKTVLEGRYYFEPCNRGFALGFGGTYNLGGIEVTVSDLRTKSGIEMASFELRPAFNAMISGYYFANLGRRGNRIHFQGGYSLPLHGDRIRQLSGSPMDPDASQPLQITSPGGPIVAIGLSFGIGRF